MASFEANRVRMAGMRGRHFNVPEFSVVPPEALHKKAVDHISPQHHVVLESAAITPVVAPEVKPTRRVKRQQATRRLRPAHA